MKWLQVIGLLLLLVGYIALGPLVVLWSLSTVFDIPITYDLAHWVSAFVLISFFGNVTFKGND